MKRLLWLTGNAAGIALVILLLAAAFELLAFNEGYYKHEYRKYGIEQAVDMTTDELMRVTSHMLDYLKGKNDSLIVYAEVGGVQREFFNDIEKYHMDDVKLLIDNAFKIRNVSMFIVGSTLLVLIWFTEDWKIILARSYRAASVAFLSVAALLGIIISTDFTKYFNLFHEIFFTNDLWILEPERDLLINIVPEPFFIDTALYICLLFVLFIAVVITLSTIYIKKYRRVQ